MSQKKLKLGLDPRRYQIRLIGEVGATSLFYERMCSDDEEAIDILAAIRDVPYACFEITQDGEMISQGARFI